MLKIEQSGIAQKSTKSNEWYTPGYIIDAAREVMGSIELDPASCALAQETVQADRYFTKEEDGLSQEWRAKTVWLNPPFNMPGKKMSQYTWAKKTYEEYKKGNIQQAIVTMYTSGKNRWFHEIWSLYDGLISIPYKRPYFLRPNGDRIELVYLACFAYLGSHEQKFIDVFNRFGTVAKRVS